MNKNPLSFLTLFLFAVSLLSCSGDETPPPSPELSVSFSTLTLPNAGGSNSFQVESNAEWTGSSSETWATMSPASGGAGTTRIDVTVQENTSSAERTANIVITSGTVSKQVMIKQQGLVILNLSENNFEIEEGGDNISIAVESSGEYQITSTPDWITASDGSTAADRKFTIAPNPSLFARSATIKFSLGTVFEVVTINQDGQPLNIAADDTGMSSNAMALAQKMNVGWNIGNSLEATSVSGGVYSASETMWGNPKVSKTLIDAVKDAGFNAIRIPCGWSGYLKDNETYQIKDSWLARVKEVIDYCVDNDMYVIINIHWDGGWLEEHPLYANQEAVNIKQKALWEQIAVYFRNYDEHLIFAGTNEVHANYNTPTAEHIEVQESYNQTFVDAVRSTGGKNTWRNLAVQAYNTNITFARDYMTMPVDADGVTDRLLAEVHFYDPYDFTLDNGSSIYLWGAEFAGSANVSNWGQEAWVDEAFGIVKTKFVDNNIPVILGEYGATLRSTLTGDALTNHIKSRNHYLNYVTKKAKENGAVPFYWDNGVTGNQGSGLFNRNTGAQVHADAVTAIMEGVD